MVLQGLLGLFGKAGSAGAGAGAGSLFSQLAGGFPVGFLGGAGYGSGLRFGFEKLYDQWFKNLDTQSIDQVIPTLQGGFGIGASFAGNQNQGSSTIQEIIPKEHINPPEPDYQGPTIPDSSLQATPAQKTATLEYENRRYNNAGRVLSSSISRISDTKKGHLERIRKMRQIKFRTKGLQASQAWKIIAYSKAFYEHYGQWPPQ